MEFCGTWKNLNKNLRGNLISINKFCKPDIYERIFIAKERRGRKIGWRVDRIFNAKKKHSILLMHCNGLRDLFLNNIWNKQILFLCTELCRGNYTQFMNSQVMDKYPRNIRGYSKAIWLGNFRILQLVRHSCSGLFLSKIHFIAEINFWKNDFAIFLVVINYILTIGLGVRSKKTKPGRTLVME